MTLIAAYNSDGCIGRCDAKCYGAKCTNCDCICRGMNHGVGRSKAESNTREYAEEWVKAWKKEHPDHEVKANPKVAQLSLFQ